jgi:putative sterol carrier protein
VFRYLSLEWIEALTAEVAASAAMQEASEGTQLGVTQVVIDGPEGEITYHLQVDDGTARFGAGPAEPEDVRFVQDWETAVAVANGTLNAQEAFIGGRIRLTGDQQKLLDSQPVFRALDGVFNAVRPETDYS